MSPPSSNVVRVPNVPSLSWSDCRLLVESVADYAIFMLNVEGRVATWNLGAEKINGYKAGEIIGKHFSTFFAPEDIEAGKPQREINAATEEGRFEDESWRVRKDGSRFWANVVITALRDDAGKLRGFGKVTRDLTARRATDEQLRQAEQKFHLLVDAITDYAVFMLDPTGHVATWNRGAERVKGYKASDIVGKKFSVFYTPEDRAAGKPDAILETVRRDGRFEDESFRLRKDGTRFWANVVITALRDDAGTLLGFAKVTRDLTLRKQAEETARERLRQETTRAVGERADVRVRESEAKYRDLSRRLEVILEGIEDGITVQDRSGRLVYANTAGARICGMTSVEQLLTAPTSEVIRRFEILDEAGVPIDSEALPGRRALAGEKPTPMLMQVHERGTGRRWWSLVRARPVLGEDGSPELAVNILHDVTAERRLQLQAQYLAEATVALGGSLVLDEMLSTLARVLVPRLGDWCSVYVLEGERLRDVTVSHDKAKEQLAKAYRQKYRPAPSYAGGVWEVIRTGKSEAVNGITDETLRRSTRDPEALAMLRSIGMTAAVLAPVRVRDKILGAIVLVSSESTRTYDDADQALVEELGRRAGVALENAQLYAATQDAAERAELSKKSAEAAARAAEEASRSKDEFLATVSHEIRTPLNAILGWSTLLKDRVKDGSIAKPLEVIHRNAQAQVKIIEDILDVSRVITGKFRIEPQPADLVAIAKEAIEVVRPSAVAKRISIDFRCVSDSYLLVADPDRLQQAAWNLMSNAVKFTDPGGQIHVGVRQEGLNVVLSVSDTGKGIDPGFLPLVFDRFRQADGSIARRFGGLGLGLAIVRHIVELHGGGVEAASEGVGKGSTFTITLPVRAVASGAAAEKTSSHQPESVGTGPTTTLRGVRVLVVDDEADARDLIEEVLVGTGAVVQTARSAREGLEALKTFRPDVLVSDIGMPDEDGYMFIRRVRSLSRSEGGSIPSLALTAFAREEDRTKAISMGYTTHIGKPVDPEALAAAVQNLASSFVHRS